MIRRELASGCVVWGLVFALFAVYAAWRSPVPGVNEPHYLGKAKHFWDPEWCARDLFLGSANAHWTFFATIGSLTRVFSLELVAWIGRILAFGGLAFAWARLARLFVDKPLFVCGSASLFVALQATGNLSGEWLLGGVESKSFAYMALILAIAAACRGSYREAGVEAGLAISLHPVIGVWGLASLVGAGVAGWCMRSLFAARSAPGVAELASVQNVSRPLNSGESSDQTRSWRSVVVPAALCLACSLPGLIPAIAMLAQAPSRDEQRQADALQVFDRLNHHLDPIEFTHSAYLMYAGLLAVWLVLGLFSDKTPAQRFLTRFILATLAVALAGLFVGIKLRNPGLMKFYPFRLFDVFLPLAVSINALASLERMANATRFRQGWRIAARVAGVALTGASLWWSFYAPGRIENAAGWHPKNWADFVDACQWIDLHVPADALFLTPKYNVGFKWYAQRAEYATWKDCPQDAAGILEWKGRLDTILRWRSTYIDEGFSDAAFAELHATTGIEYVLAWNTDAWRLKPVYRNRGLSVYAFSRITPPLSSRSDPTTLRNVITASRSDSRIPPCDRSCHTGGRRFRRRERRRSSNVLPAAVDSSGCRDQLKT